MGTRCSAQSSKVENGKASSRDDLRQALELCSSL